MSDKKHKCPEAENHERWLVAFADMMTLLFALFVVLYSIASVEQNKLQEIAKSMQEAFGLQSTVVMDSTQGTFDPVGISGRVVDLAASERLRKEKLRQLLKSKIQRLRRKLEPFLKGQEIILSKKIPLEVPKKGQVVTILENDSIRLALLMREFFEPGAYQLTPSAKSMIDLIAPHLEKEDVFYHVEGHSDAVPFQQNNMTNWELSAARAASVVRYLIQRHGFPKEILAAVGYAETRPLVSNDTPEQRALNRRVELRLFLKSSD